MGKRHVMQRTIIAASNLTRVSARKFKAELDKEFKLARRFGWTDISFSIQTDVDPYYGGVNYSAAIGVYGRPPQKKKQVR